MKKSYLFDDSGYFVGEDFAQIDPLETKNAGREIFIMPANSTDKEPLPEKDGFKIKWSGSFWFYEKIRTEKEEQREKTPEEKKAERIAELNGYLYLTDWYAIRYAETGVEIPVKIRKERQAARDEISSLRGDDA